MSSRILSASLTALLFAAGPALAHGGHDDVRSDRTHVRPSDAVTTVIVDNEVGRLITVYGDGRQLAVVPAGARERLSVPLSVQVLEARAGARRLGRLSLDGRSEYWEVERPTETNVVVENPWPMKVQVTIAGQTHTVTAEGTRVFMDVAVGPAIVVTRRVTGQLLDRDAVTLSAFDDLQWQVDRPDQGLVEIVNRWSTRLQVSLNGVVVATLEPGQSRTFSLRAGRADVSLRRLNRVGRSGAEVVDTQIRVDRYETEVMVTGPVNRSHHHTHGPQASVR